MKYAKTREEMLLSLINRKTPRAFSDDLYECVYDKKVNGGCAIGCQIGNGFNHAGSVHKIFTHLPKRLQNMGLYFLQDIQNVHDYRANWIYADTAKLCPKTGLVWNRDGRLEINAIITKYNLKLDKI